MSATERQERVEDGSAPVDDTSLGDGENPTKPLVYIAGPYSHPDPVINVREACLVADQVVEMGAAVIVPHLSMLWHTISPAPIETWYQRDVDVLRHCHSVVRLPGKSMGADNEVEEAASLGIPVYKWPGEVGYLTAWVQGWRPGQDARWGK